jgi:ketosteroid isomerase-like protein
MTSDPAPLALVQQGFECWHTGDLDLMIGMHARDAEVDLSAAFPDGRIWRGQAEMRGFWEDAWDAFDGIRMDPLEVVELDPSHYVVDVRLWGKGPRSGIEVDRRLAFLYTVDDGLIVRSRLFADTDSALAAAGTTA